MNEHTPNNHMSADLPERDHLEDTPRFWVASLSDYNNGILHGTWIDADQDDDTIEQETAVMLATSPTATRTGQPAEEYAIHDYENFGNLHIGEYENIHTLGRLGRLIAEHGEAFTAWADLIGIDQATQDDASEVFQACYIGSYPTKTAYIQEAMDDLGIETDLDKTIPTNLRPYIQIDYDMLARDMELGGDITTMEASNGGYHIFHW